MKYKINICWSGEDQVFIAEVLELPGCITHGDTHEAALANVEEAIKLWIDMANEFGDSIPDKGYVVQIEAAIDRTV